MENCIFCKIAKGEIPSDIVYETDKVVAFKDLNPIAPVHLLIIPKEHFTDFLDFAKSENRAELADAMMEAVEEIAKDLGLESFHILNNCGAEHGQSVFHLHFHLISGEDITKKIVL